MATQYGNTIANWNIVSPGILDTISRRSAPAAEVNVAPAGGLTDYFSPQEEEPNPPGLLEHFFLGKYADSMYNNKLKQQERKKEKRQLDLALRGIDKMKDGPAKDMLIADPMRWYEFNAKQEERSYQTEKSAIDRANNMADWQQQQEYQATQASQAAAAAQAIDQKQRDAYLISMGLQPGAVAPLPASGGVVPPIPDASVKQAAPGGRMTAIQQGAPAEQPGTPIADPFAEAIVQAFGPGANLDADQVFRFKSALASPTPDKDVPAIVDKINAENIETQKAFQTQQDEAAKMAQTKLAEQNEMTTREANIAQAVHSGVSTRDSAYSAIKDNAQQLSGLDTSTMTNVQKLETVYKLVSTVYDPKGSVREGDTDMLQQINSLYGRLEQEIAKATTGQPISQEVIDDAMSELLRLGADAETRQEKLRRQATKSGVARGLPKDKARDMLFGDSAIDMSDFTPSIKVPGAKKTVIIDGVTIQEN